MSASGDRVIGASGDREVLHCNGCYDPESCPGFDYGNKKPGMERHCNDCVLDDEFCQGVKELEAVVQAREQMPEANG
jgi:hypothetical protein